MQRAFLLFALLSLPIGVLGQESEVVPLVQQEESLVVELPTEAEGDAVSILTPEDVENFDIDIDQDPQVEVLPSDGWRFGLENALFQIRRVFTFSAEKKAALDRVHLFRLQQKLDACAELGDERCVSRLEEMMQLQQERTERFLERKAEVLAKHEERFETWKEKHEERLEQLKIRAEARKAQHEELMLEREERLQELRARRVERTEEREERKEERQENREERLNQKEEKREQLIKTRSEATKNRLDAAREQAAKHREEVLEQEEVFAQ